MNKLDRLSCFRWIYTVADADDVSVEMVLEQTDSKKAVGSPPTCTLAGRPNGTQTGNDFQCQDFENHKVVQTQCNV